MSNRGITHQAKLDCDEQSDPSPHYQKGEPGSDSLKIDTALIASTAVKMADVNFRGISKSKVESV